MRASKSRRRDDTKMSAVKYAGCNTACPRGDEGDGSTNMSFLIWHSPSCPPSSVATVLFAASSATVPFSSHKTLATFTAMLAVAGTDTTNQAKFSPTILPCTMSLSTPSLSPNAVSSFSTDQSSSLLIQLSSLTKQRSAAIYLQ